MAGFHNILCPVDFFPASTEAAKCAIALASRYKARLTLLHAMEPVAPWIGEIPPETRRLMAAAKDKAVKELNNLALTAKAANVRAEVVVKNGFVDTVIQSAVRAPVDLIVMGTHSRRQPVRFFLGSTTEEFLRRLPVPALITRSAAQKTCQSMKRILVTTDLSEGTSEAIAYAWSLASTYGAKMTLLHVLNDIQADLIGDYREQLIRGIQSTLDGLIPDAARDSCTVQVVTGRAIRRILRILKNDKIDFVVMNIHGKTMMDRLTIGSTAEKIIRAAEVPVLAVPGEAIRKQKAGPGKKVA